MKPASWGLGERRGKLVNSWLEPAETERQTGWRRLFPHWCGVVELHDANNWILIQTIAGRDGPHWAVSAGNCFRKILPPHTFVTPWSSPQSPPPDHHSSQEQDQKVKPLGQSLCLIWFCISASQLRERQPVQVQLPSLSVFCKGCDKIWNEGLTVIELQINDGEDQKTCYCQPVGVTVMSRLWYYKIKIGSHIFPLKLNSAFQNISNSLASVGRFASVNVLQISVALY